MMNKRGWIRIVEMFFAILLVSGAVLYVASKQVDRGDISSEVYQKQKELFSIIANNENYRAELIKIDLSNGCVSFPSTHEATFVQFVRASLLVTWDFVVNVCDITQTSNTGTPNDKAVFVSEFVVSATVNEYPSATPRKVRLAVWSK